jgi:hypothetical protein
MSRAHQRRIKARQNDLAYLAKKDPIEFEAELRSRVKGWVQTIRDRAEELSVGSAHELADGVVVEMRQLVARVPDTAPTAASVAAAIRHTAMTEIARVVDPRMARLGIWPEKDQ